MRCEELPLLVEYNLPTRFEEPLHELGVTLGENGRHENVDGVADDFILAVAEDFGQALARIEYLANGLFVPADVKDGRVVAKENV